MRKAFVCALALALTCLGGCGGASDAATTNKDGENTVVEDVSAESTSEQGADAKGAPAENAAQKTELPDGTYSVEAKTDSSMFRSEHCEISVDNGAMVAHLTLPGEGFSRLYYGSAEDAATAPDDQIYEYYLGDDGKYTFDLPVEELDVEVPIAAFGQRRDTWYDHTIIFHAPGDVA